MNPCTLPNGDAPSRLHDLLHSVTKLVEFQGQVLKSAEVLWGRIHGLRDKSTDGAWSYDVENVSFFGAIATGARGAFRRKCKDINGQSAIARVFTRNSRP
jgi:hypothetical protein